MNRHIGFVTLAAAILLSVSARAQSTDQASARPAVLNNETAMPAIFGAYNSAHKGALVPVRLTRAWDIEQATVLATPMLTAIYREGTAEKGVLVVQRRQVVNGEIQDSHANGATISVYVFTHQDGAWLFEKGKREVIEAGANGQVPDGRLIRLGDDEYGLLFQGGDIHQGYTNSYAFIVAISDPEIAPVAQFALGESNEGTCSDDPKERGDLIGKCWSYEGKLQFLRDGASPYYAIRVRYEGTQAGSDEAAPGIRPVHREELYLKGRGPYHAVRADSLEGAAPISDAKIFDAGESQARPPI